MLQAMTTTIVHFSNAYEAIFSPLFNPPLHSFLAFSQYIFHYWTINNYVFFRGFKYLVKREYIAMLFPRSQTLYFALISVQYLETYSVTRKRYKQNIYKAYQAYHIPVNSLHPLMVMCKMSDMNWKFSIGGRSDYIKLRKVHALWEKIERRKSIIPFLNESIQFLARTRRNLSRDILGTAAAALTDSFFLLVDRCVVRIDLHVWKNYYGENTSESRLLFPRWKIKSNRVCRFL